MLSKIAHLLNVINSYIFCFRYLPFTKAKNCPILIDWRVKTYISPHATIIVNKASKYSINIGCHNGSYGLRRTKTQFYIYDNAQVIFNGNAIISKGSNIIARKNASLSFGDSFFCNSNCNILANKGIYLGNNTLMGWNITIMDSDGHRIIYNNTEQESCKEVYIDNHCWIGSYPSILKGVKLDKNTVIPYGAIIHKSTNGYTNTIFMNKILKNNVEWNY